MYLGNGSSHSFLSTSLFKKERFFTFTDLQILNTHHVVYNLRCSCLCSSRGGNIFAFSSWPYTSRYFNDWQMLFKTDFSFNIQYLGWIFMNYCSFSPGTFTVEENIHRYIYCFSIILTATWPGVWGFIGLLCLYSTAFHSIWSHIEKPSHPWRVVHRPKIKPKSMHQSFLFFSPPSHTNC